MQDKPTIRDVAQKAGVAICTVSCAINRPEQISSATVARVRAAMLELNFSPRRHSKRVKRTGLEQIGLIFPHSSSVPRAMITPLGIKLTQGVDEIFSQNNIQMMISQTQLQGGIPIMLSKHQVGAVIARSGPYDAEVLEEMRGIPMVWLMGTVPALEGVDLVGVDNFKHGFNTAKELRKLPIKRVLLISPLDNHNEEHSLREVGCEWGLKDSGMEVERVSLDDLLLREKKNEWKKTALYSTGHDNEVEQIYLFLKQHQLKPCQEIPFFCTVTDAERIKALDSGIRGFSIDPLELGRTAAHRVLWRVKNPHSPSNTILVNPLAF